MEQTRMGFQPIFQLMRASGSWGQWMGKLRPGSRLERGCNASDQSAATSATQSLSRGSSGKLSDISESSGDTWGTSVSPLSSPSRGTSSISSLGAPLMPEAFNALEQGIIRQEMARCRYGLGWQWLNPRSGLRIQLTPDGRLQFSGYRARPKGDSLLPPQGDCQQLALQLGQRLHQRFQGKYKFYLVAGNYPQSPWRVHYFLMGWPAREDAYFLQKTRGAIHPFTKKPTVRLPKEAFLIDPTYRLMGFVAQHDRLCQYIAIHPQFLEVGKHASPGKTKTTFSFGEQDGLSPGLPLGFARDLLPGHPDPEAIAFVHFRRTPALPEKQSLAEQQGPSTQAPGQVPESVQVQLGWGDQPAQPVSWRQTVPPAHPLVRHAEAVGNRGVQGPPGQGEGWDGVSTLAA
jgi:hypothetical protein